MVSEVQQRCRWIVNQVMDVFTLGPRFKNNAIQAPKGLFCPQYKKNL